MSWLFGYSSAPAPATPSPAKPSSTVARRDRTAEGPTFSSAKCPPGPGLENSCELPFGFVWTPMAEIPKRPKQQQDQDAENGGSTSAASAASNAIPVVECPTSSLPPVMCLTCLAYLNPHVKVKYSTGVWTCALCGSDNVLPKRMIGTSSSLLTPALTCPMVEYHQPLPLPPQEDDVCTIVLVVDANLDSVDAKGMVKAIEQVLPDLVEKEDGPAADKDGDWTPPPPPKIQLGLVVFDQAVAMYQLGIAGVASADMYTVMLDEEEDEEARRTAMEQRPYLQSVTTPADLESLSQCISAVFGVSVDGNSSSSSQAGSRMESLKKKKEARMRQEQVRKESGVSAVELPKESPWIQKRNAVKSTQSQRRCTGEALQCAMDLASLRGSRTSRILLFTNGCPNFGEGTVVTEDGASMSAMSPAKTVKSPTKSKKKKSKHDVVDSSQMTKAIQYYDILASLAMEEGIAVDVFCSGAMELGLPAYQALVEPSGGYVLPHLTFDSPHLAHNLTYILKYTYVSRTMSDIPVGSSLTSDPPKTGLARFFGRKPTTVDEDGNRTGMSECVVDVRSDSFVVPTHLVGPGELVDSTSKTGASRVMRNEKAAFAEGSKLAAAKNFATNNLPSGEALDLSLTRIRLPRFDPLATLAVMVQVNDTIVPEEDDHAFFQMTARFISRDGKTMITRVSTHRFPVAKTVGDYVKNADDEVISVLLAKGAVYRSLHGREETEDTKDKIVAGDPETLETLAYDAQLDLDATIQRISGAFRLLGLEEKTRSIDLEYGRDEKKESSSPSSALDFAFPPQLSEGLRRLYHLRRGALISPGPMRSMDDRAEVRQLFLRFPLEDCVGMMAPKLWSTGNLENSRSSSSMQSMNPFPAETMALWESSIIAADQHDVQFVWSGKSCTQSNPFDLVRSKYKTFLQKKAKDRFPMPEIHMLFDGDSMSRRFTTRLAPSHADSPEQQLANFPELSSLSSASLERLRSRFRFYDAAADASFRKWFWSVSSATHASREDGMSLCE